MRDKKFIIDSIKMDLFRVVTAAGNLNNELPKESILEFMTHADKDFEKTELNDKEKELKQELQILGQRLSQINDPASRLRWADDVLTVRCRL